MSRRDRLDVVVSVRFSEREASELRKRAELEGQSVSSFVRQSALHRLKPHEGTDIAVAQGLTSTSYGGSIMLVEGTAQLYGASEHMGGMTVNSDL